ncbi:MAG: type I-D CRISPR-associated endonuclease Cas1d [Acidobacteriota bacterium]|nr:type I-D CRISPR-associated endonuclease Cas1d [Blastocatellia bacterium]MDW8241525.1 type I-D CRISPR-associated endonuclease Cas1d [Acidobacteriota bacterium]
MATLYITTEDAVLRKVDERLKVTKEKQTLIDVPMLKVSSIVLLGRVTVTAATVQALLEHNIPLCYLSHAGRYLGHFQPPVNGNVILRRAQYRAADAEVTVKEVARALVAGKLANMRTMLVRSRRSEEDPSSDRFITLDAAVERIKHAQDALPFATTLDQIRGHEGEASAAYFGAFDALIKADGFRFERRLKRPPRDPVNAMLSFGYTLLMHDLMAATQIVGLDPYVGFLHADRHGKPSLALDLMEEFRSIIVDSVVLTLINKRMVAPEDFQTHLGGVVLMKDSARRTFLRQYEERKLTEFQHPVFGYKVSYLRGFELQARILAKTITGELDRYVPLVVK